MLSEAPILIDAAQSSSKHKHGHSDYHHDKKNCENELSGSMNGYNELDKYLGSNHEMSGQKDDEQLKVSSLMNDLNNIRQTQQSYGIPAIGDLFRAKSDDVQETINSIYYMLKCRVADLDFRQEARQRWGKIETEKQEVVEQNGRLRGKIEQLQSELKDAKIQLSNQENKMKQERDKFQAEKEQLNKIICQLQSKETQAKHEIKNRDVQIEKLKESLKNKLFDKVNKQQINGQIEGVKDCAPIANLEVKYSKLGGESDFHLMIAKNQEEIQRKLGDENQQLKECLKLLQKELFDIVDLKTEIYMKRYKAEYGSIQGSGATGDYENEEVIIHEIEKIKEDFFNLPFQESGKEIMAKFQSIFVKFKDFMEKIDKDIAKMSVFNDKSDVVFDDVTSKFSGITTVQQLKFLLRNYDALVEGQHSLLNSSITKMAKIPPPDEISSTFNRFQVLKDSELDEMRNFLNEHKVTMKHQYKEFEQERKAFDDMTNRMESEKMKISEEREKIEAEVRKIKELNNQIQSKLLIQAK